MQDQKQKNNKLITRLDSYNSRRIKKIVNEKEIKALKSSLEKILNRDRRVINNR